MGILAVENNRQSILWKHEIVGQLSDGYWENAEPWDHWKPWADATVIIDPTRLGRDFYVKRNGYGLTSRHLLEAVGDRMLRYVRAALYLGLDDLPTELAHLLGIAHPQDDKVTDPAWDYIALSHKAYKAWLDDHGVDVDVFNEALRSDAYYSMDMLKRDLWRLQKIMKIDRCYDVVTSSDLAGWRAPRR